ncbi:DUF7619 domain-containing protein [Rasiella sp. SM2506]|uniref:DUF7619 domain-containing protein n=1 Tax=Rasiella sp. SM2506 TaxID=3423914 RepID=UPI003D7B2872
MKQFLLSIAFLHFAFIGFGQCPMTTIILNSQADVDSFATNYPNCTEIYSIFRINSTSTTDPITNLLGLSSIQKVRRLEIGYNDLLVSTEGLENLLFFDDPGDLPRVNVYNNSNLETIHNLCATGVGLFQLSVSNNQNLTNLNGFSNIVESTEIFILNNDSLLDLQGLENIAVMRELNVGQNELLQTTQGLNNVLLDPSEPGTIHIFDNEVLASIPNLLGAASDIDELTLADNLLLQDLSGLNQIFSVNRLYIENNETLTDLTPFQNINDAKTLVISDNDMLQTTAGLENVEFIPSPGLPTFVNIRFNNILTEIPNLTATGSNVETLYIRDNPSIQSLSGLSGVVSAEILDIDGNTLLPNLLGLEQLDIVEKQIRIRDNAILQSTMGFDNVFIDSENFISGGNLSILNNPMLENIDNLIASNSVVYSLDIQNNTSLNSLSGLNGLGDVSHSISINNNPVENLLPLSNITNASLYSLLISSCPNLVSLEGLEGVTTVTDNISITGNTQLENLNGLQPTSGTQLDYVTLVGNPSLTSLVGLEGITTFNIKFEIRDNDVLQSLDGIAPALVLGSQLFIYQNEELHDINVLQGATLEGYNFVKIEDNPNLSHCSVGAICNILTNTTNYSIANNAPGCNSDAEILAICGQNLNVVSGNVRFDFNMDTCDLGDYPANNLLVKVTNGVNSITANVDEDGNYLLYVLEGTYDVSLVEASIPIFFEANPSGSTIVFSGFGNQETVDFCLAATQSVDDIKITLISINDARPGFMSSYILVYENVGTNISNGEITLQFDELRQDFISSNPVHDVFSNNEITWDFVNLVPFESRSIAIDFNNFPPPVNNADDILMFQVDVVPQLIDANPGDNEYSLTQILVNSQDPNDKTVNQGETIAIEAVGDYLEYVVRFQNIGTASAINVRIEDELSSKLNWETFRVLSASHDYRLEITDGDNVDIIFENINLPSVNDDPEGSNGYVAFQVKSLSNLVLGDIIDNEANIFFDFNAPIITNTVQTTISDLIPPLASCMDIEVFLDENGMVSINASQIDDGSVDNVEIGSLEVFPNTFTCVEIGTNQVTLIVTDTSGLESTCTAIVTIVDELMPIVTCDTDFVEQIELGATFEVPNYYNEGIVTAFDNCTLPLTDVSQNPVPGTQLDPGQYIISTTVTDASGNDNNCTFNLTIETVLSISEVVLESIVLLIPNPVSDTLTISIASNFNFIKAEVYSISGQKLMETLATQVDMSDLSTGIYFVTVVTESGSITKKIVKQ